MSLWFRDRPGVQVLAPLVVTAGERAAISVALTCAADLRVEHVDVEVDGYEAWSVQQQGWRQGHRYANSAHVPHLLAQIHGPGVLPAGVTTLPMLFDLPPETAPSHDSGYARAQLVLRVHTYSGPHHAVDEHLLYVRRRPPPYLARTPAAYRSEVAQPDHPRIELALASTTLAVGETITGTCALFHFEDGVRHFLDIALRSTLAMWGDGTHEQAWARSTVFVEVSPDQLGESIAFELPVPTDLAPTFTSATHRMTWTLEARSGGFLTRSAILTIPLELHDSSAFSPGVPLPPPPPLTDAWSASVLAELATADGWTASRDPRIHSTSVEKDTAHGHLRIAYIHRGEAGTFLVSHVTTASLGLGLDVAPTSRTQQDDIAIDLAAWDRANFVRARSAEQTVPVLKAIVPAIADNSALGTLVRWTDTDLVLERRTEGADRAELTAMARELEVVATILDGARGQVRPPAGVAIDPAAWRDLARSWRATLSFGDLSLDGTLDADLPVRVRLRFDDAGRPIALDATVGSPADGEVSGSLPLPGSPATLDAGAVRELVMSLRSTRAPDRGPYR